MAFLIVDGITVPVATRTADRKIVAVGGVGRSFSGKSQLSIRSYKTEISGETTPMTEADAEALKTLLLGNGVLFCFSDSPYSSAGYVPVTATGLTYSSTVPFGSAFSNKSLDVATSSGRLQLASATRNPFGAGWSNAWSLNVWASAADGYLYYVAATNYLSVSGTTVTWVTPQGGTLTGTRVTAGSVWSMLTVQQRRTSAGACISELWIDGALAATLTASATVPFDPGAATSFDLGSDGGANRFAGLIESVMFVPCRLTSAWLVKMFNARAGALSGAWPRHLISGDVITDRAPFEAHIQAETLQDREYNAAGVWQNNGRSVAFQIMEV